MAKECIEREKALEKVIEVKHHDPELNGVVLHRYIKEIDLKDIPAADVAEIVRCRECKFYKLDYCNIWCRWTNENVFCSHGERKED